MHAVYGQQTLIDPWVADCYPGLARWSFVACSTASHATRPGTSRWCAGGHVSAASEKVPAAVGWVCRASIACVKRARSGSRALSHTPAVVFSIICWSRSQRQKGCMAAEWYIPVHEHCSATVSAHARWRGGDGRCLPGSSWQTFVACLLAEGPAMRRGVWCWVG